MALSMDEQRILDQIERGLASADPALATRMASFGASRRITTLRMRRLRLVASLMTLLVVAIGVAGGVRAGPVPDRGRPARRRQGQLAPAQPVMTAPSHAGQASPRASGALASPAPASASPGLGASAAASPAASQAPSTHAGTSASPASGHQQARRTPAQ